MCCLYWQVCDWEHQPVDQHLHSVSSGPEGVWQCSQTDAGGHTTLHTTHCTLHVKIHTTQYTLHYTTLHYTTLHYTTLHYTTLHYTTHSAPGQKECDNALRQMQVGTLHYTLHTAHYTLKYTLHSTHYTTLHYTTLHYTTLHYTTHSAPGQKGCDNALRQMQVGTLHYTLYTTR